MIEWLQQVIERVGLECANRILVKCGSENYNWQILRWKGLENRKAIHIGKADVEQEKVRLCPLQRGNCGGPTLAFRDDSDVRFRCEKDRQFFSRRPFVLHDHCA